MDANAQETTHGIAVEDAREHSCGLVKEKIVNMGGRLITRQQTDQIHFQTARFFVSLVIRLQELTVDRYSLLRNNSLPLYIVTYARGAN